MTTNVTWCEICGVRPATRGTTQTPPPLTVYLPCSTCLPSLNTEMVAELDMRLREVDSMAVNRLLGTMSE